MKRAWLVAALFAGVALCSSGVAFASSHSAPAEMTFLGMVLWEFQHFAIHMGLTASAIFTGVTTSPALAWALMGDQTLCATLSPVVGVLFSSAWSALLTFALVIFTLTAFVIWAMHLAWRKFSARSLKRHLAIAYA